jgi:DNA-binding IclR family transcriptional regulator
LRVPEVLSACASRPQGASLATLCKELEMPKSSLYRMLRTLENGGYLTHEDGCYLPGPASFHMATLIAQRQHETPFPSSARPTVEWLAKETSESVMIGMLSDDRKAVTYVLGIDSTEPLRYTVPLGGRRPLFSGASGKAILAFMSKDEQIAYIATADFFQMTPSSTKREEMPELLKQTATDGAIYERNGSFEGACALASPIFDNEGQAFAAISVAGPTERMDLNRDKFIALTRSAAERISRGLGYMGLYPPRDS